MIAQNNVTHMYVCSNTAAVTTAAPTVARTMGMKKIGEQLCSVEAITAGDGFQILYLDANSELQVSPVLFWDNLVKVSKLAASADAAQVVAVGYNGTTGSIEVNNGGEYLLTIGYREGMKQFNKKLYKYGQYTADATATQYEIADGIQTTLLASIAKDPYVMFKVEKINSGAQLNAMASATATVVNGSKVVTLSEDESLTCPAGSFIRFGTTGAGVAPVYKVESISVDGKTIVLDQPYQGTSATIVHTAVETLTEGNWGLLITAMDSNKPFEVGKWAFNPTLFDVGLSVDFGSTPVTVNTVAARGIGTYKDIAEKEWFLLGNRREAFRIAEYPIDINSALGATSGETYTTYVAEFKEESTKTIGGTADSFITLMICAAGANLTANLDKIFFNIG